MIANEVNNEAYWIQLIRFMLRPIEKLPARPAIWNRRRQSQGNWIRANTNPLSLSSPNRNKKALPPCSNRREHGYHLRKKQNNSNNTNQSREWVNDNVGRLLYDSLDILGLVGFGVSKTEVQVRFRALPWVCHPDKHIPEAAGMTND